MGTKRPDDPGVLADLITEFLIHSHNHCIGRFDILERLLESILNVLCVVDSAASGQDLVAFWLRNA